MEPTDLTVEILKDIRTQLVELTKGQAESNVRLDAVRTELSTRLDRHEQVLERLVAGQERHEQVLIQLVRQAELTNERLDRHELALGRLIDEVQAVGTRIDNVLTGPIGEKVRDLDRRVTALEARAEP